ncbi:hypothetical protein Y1Q_0004847 [Alligator mississippiensis]|uniref:Uncharacterized protein n=1 Tax=Alligator mississippiensis TaxID=8496 RepID=A0A151NR49_ALLMI|nr:hypothetical protein Y1Q_0004847 [Alligator mississippiensis]
MEEGEVLTHYPAPDQVCCHCHCHHENTGHEGSLRKIARQIGLSAPSVPVWLLEIPRQACQVCGQVLARQRSRRYSREREREGQFSLVTEKSGVAYVQ